QVGDIAIFRYDVVFNYVINVETDTLEYKNMIWYKGKEYWLVDIQQIFGVIRNSSIKMVNGYCMLENVSKESQIVLPQSMKRIVRAKEATLSHIGSNLEGLKMIDAFPGDTVYVNPFKIQNYHIKEKK